MAWIRAATKPEQQLLDDPRHAPGRPGIRDLAPEWRDPMKSPKYRYLIARNKITRLVDVIDTETMKVVSKDHPNHDAAEKFASKLLLAQSPQGRRGAP